MAHATLDSAEMFTSPGTAVGTVAYMSPEQVRGKELDARSDLFSFGTVLYEMSTGVLPFQGETTGVIFEAVLNRMPPRLRASILKFHPKLDEILQKALEKDREMRYQVAAEIRADLKRLRREADSSGRISCQRQLADFRQHRDSRGGIVRTASRADFFAVGPRQSAIPAQVPTVLQVAGRAQNRNSVDRARRSRSGWRGSVRHLFVCCAQKDVRPSNTSR